MIRITVNSLDDTDRAAAEFLDKLQGRSIVAFHGEMGAGKTTFTKAICKHLGVRDMVNSPTFAIVNEYEDDKGEKIYHFDFYRVKSAAEAIDIGLYDYLSSGCLCLMEWPEIIEDVLPEETLHVYISEDSDSKRIISFD